LSTQRAQLPADDTMAFANAFWSALPSDVRAVLAEDHELAARLETAWQTAAAAWRELTVSAEHFGVWLAERSTDAAELDALLAPTALAELFLACACARGDRAAMRCLEACYFPLVRGALARMRLPADTVDEVMQGLRAQLLMRGRDGGPPGIAGFRGRGALGAWLSVNAVRAASKQLKRGKNQRSDGDAALQRLSAPARNVEEQYTRAWSRDAFERAFVMAMAQLSAREKTLLRLHYLDGVTIDQLGTVYRTHRATAARWLAAARQRLLDRTRAALIEELQIPLADCDSIIAAAQSQLELTLHRLFATRPR